MNFGDKPNATTLLSFLLLCPIAPGYKSPPIFSLSFCVSFSSQKVCAIVCMYEWMTLLHFYNIHNNKLEIWLEILFQSEAGHLQYLCLSILNHKP